MRARFLLLCIVAGLVLVLLGGWASVVLAQDPLASPLSQLLPWPVMCTTRGCVTTLAWQQHEEARATFNQALDLPQASHAETLTTLIRQHLVAHAVVRSSVTPADARRYREEILNAKDAVALEHATALSQEEYDRLVVLPFLQQEALRQQRHAETSEELFKQLAAERWAVVLIRGLRWDKEEGKVSPGQ